MKILYTTICLVMLTLFAITGNAQDKKVGRPFLFANFPATIHCTATQLSSLFAASKGENIQVTLAGNFSIAGPVTSNLEKYSNLHTIVIQLPAFKNSLLSLSKQTDSADNITYVGRILNPLYADGFELRQHADGNYEFIKTDLAKIVVNCNL